MQKTGILLLFFLLTTSMALSDHLDNWTVRPSGVSQRLHGVAYGNNTFVAVGEKGLILQSDSFSDVKVEKKDLFFNKISNFSGKTLSDFLHDFDPAILQAEIGKDNPFGCELYEGVSAEHQCKALVRYYSEYVLEPQKESDSYRIPTDPNVINHLSNEQDLPSANLIALGKGANTTLLNQNPEHGDIIFIYMLPEIRVGHYAIILDWRDEKREILDANWDKKGSLAIHDIKSKIPEKEWAIWRFNIPSAQSSELKAQPIAKDVIQPQEKASETTKLTINDEDDSWLTVPQGQFTFDLEGAGDETLTIHPPGGDSGVTIGRGYDIGKHSWEEVIKDLTRVGIPEKNAKKLAEAIPIKEKEEVKKFCKENENEEWAKITKKQQYHLFNNTYRKYVEYARKAMKSGTKTWSIERKNEETTTYKYGIQFDDLADDIQDIVVSIIYNIGEGKFVNQNWGGIFLMDSPEEMADYIEGKIEGYILDENGKREKNKEGEFELAENQLNKWRQQVPARVKAILALLRSPQPLSPGAKSHPGPEIEISDSEDIKLLWKGVDSATEYEIWVSKEPYGAENIVWSGSVSASDRDSSCFIPKEKFLPGNSYRWHIRAKKEGEWGPLSGHLYFKIPERGNAIVIVMDCSGSMSGDRLTKAKEAAVGFFACLQPQDYSGLITFHSKATLEVPLVLIDDKNKQKLQEKVSKVIASGSTNITAGLEAAFHQLDSADATINKAVLLMSDGEHNVGINPLKGNPSIAQRFAEAGWPIYTLAYTRGSHQTTLAKISEKTNGMYLSAEDSNITQAYQKILAYAHNQSVLTSYNDIISQDGLLEYEIPVGPNILATTFFTDWQGSTVELSLKTPTGADINQKNFGSFPGISYQSGATFASFHIKNPQQGIWKATLYGKDIPKEKEQVNFTVSGKSPFMTNIFGLQPYYRPKEEIAIKVKIAEFFLEKDREDKLRNIKVTAEIKKPAPNLKTMLRKRVIELGRFVKHAFAHTKNIVLLNKGNGIFSATFKDTDENGAYLITIRCEAQKSDGTEVVRILKESVQVGPIEDNKVTLADFLGIKK